ncbi:2676_t:CDS:2, partial [Cetraspora pellucida]
KCPTVFMSKTSTTNIAAHLHTEYQIFKTQKWKEPSPSPSTTIPMPTGHQTIEQPISSDTVTRWNFTYLVLQQLLELQELILELAKSLANNPNHTTHADDNSLNEKMLSDEEWIDRNDMYESLQESMVSRWSDPEMIGWLASFLDPYFKTLSATLSTMQQEVLQELYKNIEISYHTNNLLTTNSALDTEMSSFFDNRIEPSSFSSIDTEL